MSAEPERALPVLERLLVLREQLDASRPPTDDERSRANAELAIATRAVLDGDRAGQRCSRDGQLAGLRLAINDVVLVLSPEAGTRAGACAPEDLRARAARLKGASRGR